MKISLPLAIDSGVWTSGHCQGLAVDAKRGWACFSFTTAFVKRDLAGQPLGSVDGLWGHLGCIAKSPSDGRVYASLEYKNDEIGRGIQKMLHASGELDNAFYAAIFDVDKIDRAHMSAADGGVMTAVALKKPLEDYLYAPEGGPAHRWGCSGIDGISFGPMFGSGPDSRQDLFVAYGIYGDNSRRDNDHQVLLRYDISNWKPYEAPLAPGRMHMRGPDAPDDVLFAYTGNTTYGVQNLEYDAWARRWLMAVYRGKKPGFPNYPMFALDAEKAPEEAPLAGAPGNARGKRLRLMEKGLRDEATGIRGYAFPYGQTGLCAMGGGLYYVSRDEKVENGWKSTAVLYKHDEERLMVPATEDDARAYEI